ncbi:hypothetical protein CR513_46623, partial [Mucuna pruriens]
MENEPSNKESTLILGRPFLMTARTKIDVHAGILSMEFGVNMVQFNIFEAMKHPTENHFVFGLDYAYLEDDQKLPIIIANNLQFEQEERLRKHKKAIAWTLADLLGINPSICVHRILLEEEAQLVRQPQRRQWVSLVQVVPKKSGMTVVKNQNDELVPTRIQNSW